MSMDFVRPLAHRIGELGEEQVRQLVRLTTFFGEDWIRAREAEALSSSVESVARRKDGGERTLGGRFFRCCRRACWKAYSAGALASREAIAWFFDPAAVPPPGELRGTGKRRRQTHGGKKHKLAAERPAPRLRRTEHIGDWPAPASGHRYQEPRRTSCEPRLPPIPIGPPRPEPEPRKRTPRHLAPPPAAEVYVIRRRTG